jgi:hypothetical protein
MALSVVTASTASVISWLDRAKYDHHHLPCLHIQIDVPQHVQHTEMLSAEDARTIGASPLGFCMPAEARRELQPGSCPPM